jgi:regulator of replication initiation timing
MYPNLDDASSNYEDTLKKLSNHIKELFSKIQLYQAIISERDHQINKLVNENNQLKMQVQNLSNQLNPRYEPDTSSYTPPAPKQQPTTSSISSEDPRIMKRQCPNCGASGFAIREVEDKSKIISYVPRRIYAKKMVCTKCRFEF